MKVAFLTCESLTIIGTPLYKEGDWVFEIYEKNGGGGQIFLPIKMEGLVK